MIPQTEEAVVRGRTFLCFPEEVPLITVIVPVRNEETFISGTLTAILRQDYPKDRIEVIVADGESADRTKEVVTQIASKDQRVRLLDNPKRLSSAGRNVGLKHGRGDVFLFIDGHCRIANDQLLRNVVKAFEKSGAMCLSRTQPLVHENNSPTQKAIAAARSFWMGHGLKSDIYTQKEGFVSPVSAGAVYRREIIEKVGVFDETFDACEDVEFNYRVKQAGFRAFTTPNIAVGYVPRTTLQGLFRQQVRYGAGRCRLVRKHRSLLGLDTLALPFFVVGLFLWPSAILVPGFRWAFIIPYGAYAGCVLLGSAWLAITRKIRRFYLLPAALFLTHLGLGLGFLKELFTSHVGERPATDKCAVTEHETV